MPQQKQIKSVRSRDVFSDRYDRRRERLSPASLRVAAYIDHNRLAVLTSSAIEIARAVGTSDATVVRAVQALGFSGLGELRRELAASFGTRVTPEENLKRTLDESPKGAEEAFDRMLDLYASGLEALRTPEFRADFFRALAVLQNATRIVAFGVGPTAHVAAYFVQRLRRKGKESHILDRTGTALAEQLMDLRRGDALVMLAYGSLYREADVTLSEARRLHMPVILITDTAKGGFTSRADVSLTVPRGEAERFTLHGVTVFFLEMLVLALAAADSENALSALSDLQRLRQLMRSGRISAKIDRE